MTQKDLATSSQAVASWGLRPECFDNFERMIPMHREGQNKSCDAAVNEEIMTIIEPVMIGLIGIKLIIREIHYHIAHANHWGVTDRIVPLVVNLKQLSAPHV